MVEYQGSMVRVAIMTEDGLEAAALLPDHEYHGHPLVPGDATMLSWKTTAAHPLAHY